MHLVIVSLCAHLFVLQHRHVKIQNSFDNMVSYEADKSGYWRRKTGQVLLNMLALSVIHLSQLPYDYLVLLIWVFDFLDVFWGKKWRRTRFWLNLNPVSGSLGDILRFVKFSERKILIFVYFLTKDSAYNVFRVKYVPY